MTPSFGNRYLVLLALGFAMVGTVDAVWSDELDFLTVFVLVDAALLALPAGSFPASRAPGKVVGGRSRLAAQPLGRIAGEDPWAYNARDLPQR